MGGRTAETERREDNGLEGDAGGGRRDAEGDRVRRRLGVYAQALVVPDGGGAQRRGGCAATHTCVGVSECSNHFWSKLYWPVHNRRRVHPRNMGSTSPLDYDAHELTCHASQDTTEQFQRAGNVANIVGSSLLYKFPCRVCGRWRLLLGCGVNESDYIPVFVSTGLWGPRGRRIRAAHRRSCRRSPTRCGSSCGAG